MKGAVEEEWVGQEPGRLPWWRLGRPPKGENEDPEDAVRKRRRKEQLGPDWRPEFDAETFVNKVAAHLGLDEGDLRASGRSEEVVEARELVMTLGVERYRLKVKVLADQLGKSPGGMSQTLARGVAKMERGLSELQPVEAKASRKLRRAGPDRRVVPDSRGREQLLLGCLRNAVGVCPVQRLNARLNALCSENPVRNATSVRGYELSRRRFTPRVGEFRNQALEREVPRPAAGEGSFHSSPGVGRRRPSSVSRAQRS